MKTLSAREYLGQLEFLDTSINQDLERLNDMRINACSTGGIDYSDERVQTSPSGDAKNLIIKQIRGLHNNYFNQILFKVYVQFKSVKQASKEMKKSYNYTVELHNKALAAFEETYENLTYLI